MHNIYGKCDPRGKAKKDVINCRLYLVNRKLEILLGHETVYLIIIPIWTDKIFVTM